jgi:hypothetical protein
VKCNSLSQIYLKSELQYFDSMIYLACWDYHIDLNLSYQKVHVLHWRVSSQISYF